MPNLGELYRQNLAAQLQGQNANRFQGAAYQQALAGAQSLGAGMAGTSPALAARQAQQAAARTTAQTTAQAAQMRLGEQQQANQMAMAQEQADRQQVERYIGLGLQTAGSAASMLLSDEDAKRELGGGGEHTDEFIAALEPERYQYREGMGPGDVRLGVMAQDVEQGGPVGRSVVGRRPDGMRGLDRDKTLGAILASVGRIGERLEQLEGRGR